MGVILVKEIKTVLIVVGAIFVNVQWVTVSHPQGTVKIS